MLASFEKELDVLIKSRHPLVYMVSWEEQRALGILRRVAKLGTTPKHLITWTASEGFEGDLIKGIKDPLHALDSVESYDHPAIFVFLDLHPFLRQNPVIVRRLRTLTERLQRTTKTLMLLSPVLYIPEELQKTVTVVDLALPTQEEMVQLIESMIQQYHGVEGVEIRLNDEERQRLVAAAGGLTLEEAENALAKLLVSQRKLDASAIQVMYKEKRQIIRKTGMLEFFPVQEDMSQVGGLDNLKSWLQKRKRAFTEEARRFGIPTPKGVLLTGMPGCGKSLSVKASSQLLEMPLLRMDVGKIFGHLVGSSEENMRMAIATAEAVAPAILWIDEIEKGFSGLGGDGDSGTSSRVFATFLTWLQEKRSPLFVMATANDISRLPAELLRKGRFDEIFFIDLPMPAEREEILRIHLSKRGRDPAKYDLAELVAMTDGFSGAELEQAVVAALVEAFEEGRELQQQDLVTGVKRTVPLSQTMQEHLEWIRNWANERAVRASRLPIGKPHESLSAVSAGRNIEF